MMQYVWKVRYNNRQLYTIKGALVLKYIESVKNPTVKAWKKLLTKKERDRSGRFLIEGYHLVEEALKEKLVTEVIVNQDMDKQPSIIIEGTEVIYVTNEVMKTICDTETPQGIAAVCEKPSMSLDLAKAKKLLLLDRVQDPGNMGTLIRTADAAGIDAVILGEGCADPYNPKVVRSTQGSLFHLPIVKADLPQFLDTLTIPVYGTSLEGGVHFETVEKSDAFALLAGNEGQGVAQELLDKTTKNIYIPIYGKCESLNVGVAAGILMYYLRK